MLRQVTHYPRRAAEIYRDGGLDAFVSECQTHIKWRRNRLRIHPSFRTPYTTALRVRRLLQPARFSDAYPFKILFLDADRIDKRAPELPRTWGRVIGGSWTTEPFADNYFYRALEARHVHGRSWDDIDHDLEDPTKWDALYERIRTEGFRSQREIRARGDHSDRFTTDCEIGVGIDRDGEFVWVACGFHRLSIAKLLNLPAVPVQVRIRHPAWQAVRNEVRAASSVADLSDRARTHLSHPDLADVRGSIDAN